MSSSDTRFTDRWDAVNPFDQDYPHLWIKVEHLGRYLFAAQYLLAAQARAVLDAGCGQGYGTAEIVDVCQEVTAVDSDEEVLTAARKKNPHERIRYLQADLTSKQLEAELGTGSQDGVVCFETLEHLTDPERTLSEFFALLRPGGMLVASVPNGVNERSNETGLLSNRLHRRAFSISSIHDLFHSAGFEIQEVLGQPLPNVISGNESRLLRRKQMDDRIGDEPALHHPSMIRRMALAIGYPEPRDVERSYSIIIVARRPG